MHLATERLAEKLHTIIILRLLLGRRGRLEHGEVIDAEGRVRRGFRGWSHLSDAVRASVTEQGSPASQDHHALGKE